MQDLNNYELIQCRFGNDSVKPGCLSKGNITIYYAETESLISILPVLYNIIGAEEKRNAGKLTPMRNRETYIVSHAVLRLYLSGYLNSDPGDIIYNYSKHRKPGIENDPVYFNLAHTQEAFAIAVSEHCYVGLDLEKITKMADMASIVKNYFSKAEQEFIFRSSDEMEERFFLLWTRKESFLKALGTGIIDDLENIEVCGQFNNISKTLFEGLIPGDYKNEHYICSAKYNYNYISVTAPLYPVIDFFHIKADNLNCLLCR
jgi:4'-phosphopantetheinyl transferase